jgi:hypothetical protein
MASSDHEPMQPTQPREGQPVEIPVPKRSTWDKLFSKVSKPGRDEGRGKPGK